MLAWNVGKRQSVCGDLHLERVLPGRNSIPRPFNVRARHMPLDPALWLLLYRYTSNKLQPKSVVLTPHNTPYILGRGIETIK